MGETHEIVVLKPKPSSDKIREMVSNYFDQEASGYDQFNETIEKRKLFTLSVDQIIAADLKTRSVSRILSIGAGTGKREQRIRELSKLDFAITATDISGNMCGIMEQRGIRTFCGAWECIDMPNEEKESFDAVFLLHCFGLIASSGDRLTALAKAQGCLKHGGVLYVDVLNLDDRDEWGPEIRQVFAQHDLCEGGYEMGDVIYRRVGAEAISFCHYFDRREMIQLLQEAGLETAKIYNVGYASEHGQILETEDRGSMVFVGVKR
jgi:ubiquinone/menaquinone biosynthesis C-methylase UbiE